MGDRPKRRIAVTAGVVFGSVLLAGGVYWAVCAGGPDLEQELTSGDADRMRSALVLADAEQFKGKDASQRRRLTIETMKKMPVGDLMELWQGQDLSDEERELLGKNMRTLWMGYMGEIADEYLAASPEEKTRILDRQIDDWMSFIERKREYDEAHQDDPEYQKRREEDRKRWRNPSKEDRKEQMAETSPDQQAKMFFMFRAMGKRATERGIDFGKGSGRGGKQGKREGRDDDSRRQRDRDSERGRGREDGRDRDRDGDRRGN